MGTEKGCVGPPQVSSSWESPRHQAEPWLPTSAPQTFDRGTTQTIRKAGSRVPGTPSLYNARRPWVSVRGGTAQG